jgi:hypothetical protein
MGKKRAGKSAKAATLSTARAPITDDELNAALRYLTQLAADRRDPGMRASELDEVLKTESLLMGVVSALLSHQQRRDGHSLQVKLAHLLPNIEPLLKPWLKGPRKELEELPSRVTVVIHDLDPLLRKAVSVDAVRDALIGLQRSRKVQNPRRDTALFLGHLCGASDSTMLNLYRLLHGAKAEEGAVKSRSQAEAFRDDYPGNFPPEFSRLNERWLACWDLGVKREHLQKMVSVILAVYYDALTGRTR